ncbi:MAG: hypothetical protein ACK559_03990, partial [bacterium]
MAEGADEGVTGHHHVVAARQREAAHRRGQAVEVDQLVDLPGPRRHGHAEGQQAVVARLQGARRAQVGPVGADGDPEGLVVVGDGHAG